MIFDHDGKWQARRARGAFWPCRVSAEPSLAAIKSAKEDRAACMVWPRSFPGRLHGSWSFVLLRVFMRCLFRGWARHWLVPQGAGLLLFVPRVNPLRGVFDNFFSSMNSVAYKLSGGHYENFSGIGAQFRLKKPTPPVRFACGGMVYLCRFSDSGETTAPVIVDEGLERLRALDKSRPSMHEGPRCMKGRGA